MSTSGIWQTFLKSGSPAGSGGVGRTAAFLLLCALPAPGNTRADSRSAYPWPTSNDSRSLAERIKPPAGFKRESVAAESFQHWLRHLPVKDGRPAVRLFDGRLKANQDAHYAVLDIDVGRRDLQQCADAVMRLRAEYLYSRELYDKIQFDFTDGVPARYSLWRRGFRPKLSRPTRWVRSARPDDSYRGFRNYLVSVFSYAGTFSLNREMRPIDSRDMRAGDVFIQGGFPGHAVIVVDTAVDAARGRRAFLLAQSYMPAQDMHILRNPGGDGPWYFDDFGDQLETPEWAFSARDLKRFR